MASLTVMFNDTGMFGVDAVANNFGVTSLDATVTVNSAATPLPAALPLFATGIGAMGLIGWRRKRKAQAVA
jgi:hypothetical protein